MTDAGRQRLLSDVAGVNDDDLSLVLAVDKALPAAENLGETLTLEKYGVTGKLLVDMLRDNAPLDWDYAHAFNDFAGCPASTQRLIIADVKCSAAGRLAKDVSLQKFANIYQAILGDLLTAIEVRSRQIPDRAAVMQYNKNKLQQDPHCSRIAYFHYKD